MDILLTNDDGPVAPGILAAFDALSGIATVSVVAPKDGRSGVSHAITISTSLEAEEMSRGGGRYGFAVNGTPADAVKLGVKVLLPRKPELIVAGINAGLNLGFNSFYSGTVAAALEGAILGIPSIAISLDVLNGGRFDAAATVLRELVRRCLEAPLPAGEALSVNVPAQLSSPPACALTRHSRVGLVETYHPCGWEAGRRVYALGREYLEGDPEPDSDVAAINAGLISISRLVPNLNSRSSKRKTEKWLKEAGLKVAELSS